MVGIQFEFESRSGVLDTLLYITFIIRKMALLALYINIILFWDLNGIYTLR